MSRKVRESSTVSYRESKKKEPACGRECRIYKNVINFWKHVRQGKGIFRHRYKIEQEDQTSRGKLAISQKTASGICAATKDWNTIHPGVPVGEASNVSEMQRKEFCVRANKPTIPKKAHLRTSECTDLIVPYR